ncbi:MAG: zinc-dependent alcohol dehydrogenase family protein [Burkholderiaceae bacterium]
MKRAYLTAFGNPSDVVEIRDDPEPGQPAGAQVLVEILAASINPAELLLIQGRYASRPPLPAPLGIEGVGRVLAVGPQAQGFEVGDLVMSLGRQNWAERLLLEAGELIRLPHRTDPLQAAMLKVNPATALMMLRDIVPLTAGDWVLQNAANSGVGRNLIRLAASMPVKTVNIVRRDSLVDELEREGADAVIVDGPDLVQRVRDAVDGPIRLGIDAIGGSATGQMAQCLAEGAVIANYGLLSGQPCQIGTEQVIFRSIVLRGFWLAKELSNMDRAGVEALYTDLADQVLAGTLHVPVEATYDLAEIGAALEHALREGRDGKILLTPVRV